MNDINADIKLAPIELSDQDLVVRAWAEQHWNAYSTWHQFRGFYYAEWAREHKVLELPKSKAA